VEKGKPYGEQQVANIKPHIAQMSIAWPLSNACYDIDNQFKCKLINDHGEDVIVYYNPINACLEAKKIPLLLKDKELKPEEGTGLYNFQSKLMLYVDNPGSFYTQEQLSCEFKIKVPCIYSNLHLYYFDIYGGVDKNISAEINTTLQAKVTVLIEDRFKKRTFSPYHYLIFEGVLLDYERLMDIKELLVDNNFTDIVFDPKPEYLGFESRYTIVGFRMEGRSKLKLTMHIDGRKKDATRASQMNGDIRGETHTLSREVGHITIHVRGELEGDSHVLFNILNTIQENLKKKFHYVSAL
jgi:hypothetical protein